MTTDEHFYTWWTSIGNGIAVLQNHDHNEHAQRVAHFAWIDSRGQAFREDLTTKEDYFRRLGDLLGVSEQLLKERDEARREACERTAENLSLLGSNVRLSTLRVEHAARRGWECFKEEKTDGK